MIRPCYFITPSKDDIYQLNVYQLPGSVKCDVTDQCLEATVVKRALDSSLDIFGPLIKQAVFAELEKRLSLSDSQYTDRQIEEALVETVGNPAGKILIKRFREEIKINTA